MQSLFRYRGCNYSAAQIESIRQLIAAHPGLSRRRLSVKLCQAWNWVQPNGQPRDMVARSLMLELHRAGHLELPAKRVSPPNNAVVHGRAVWTCQPERQSQLGLGLKPVPLECSLGQLGPLEIRLVRRTPQEGLFDGLLQSCCRPRPGSWLRNYYGPSNGSWVPSKPRRPPSAGWGG